MLWNQYNHMLEEHLMTCRKVQLSFYILILCAYERERERDKKQWVGGERDKERLREREERYFRKCPPGIGKTM